MASAWFVERVSALDGEASSPEFPSRALSRMSSKLGILALSVALFMLGGCVQPATSPQAPELPALGEEGAGSGSMYIGYTCRWVSAREEAGQEREYRGPSPQDRPDGSPWQPPEGRVVVDVGDEDWIRVSFTYYFEGDDYERLWIDPPRGMQIMEGDMESTGPFDGRAIILEFRVLADEPGYFTFNAWFEGGNRPADGGPGLCPGPDYTVQEKPSGEPE